MKVRELMFDCYRGDSLRKCVLDKTNKESEAIRRIIRKSEDTKDFVKRFLADTRFAKTEAYQAVVSCYGDTWRYIRGVFGENCKHIFSRTGLGIGPEGIKVGNEGFQIIIPNAAIGGDGFTRYAVFEGGFYLNNKWIMKYLTCIHGKINIYKGVSETEAVETLDGTYQIYYYDGFIAFVKTICNMY